MWVGSGILSSAFALSFLEFYGGVVTCVFDRTLGTLTLKKKGLLDTKVSEHQIGEIADIFVEKDDEYNNSQIFLVMHSRKRFYLNNYLQNDNRGNQETANRIREFLKLNN